MGGGFFSFLMTILASYVFWIKLKRKWLEFLVCSGWKKKQSRATPSHLLHHQEQCFGTNMEVGLVNGAGILFPLLPPVAVASTVDGIWILWGWRVPLILLTHGSQHGSYRGPGQRWWLSVLPVFFLYWKPVITAPDGFCPLEGWQGSGKD